MRRTRITVLAGGVGGARFLRGLSPLTEPSRLTVIGNTGDDETFFGLHVSPDLDTLVYTLAGRSDPLQGWGIAGDTFTVLDDVARLGGDTWFRLGDRDLATHLVRTAALGRGVSLTKVTADLARRFGVRQRVLPMTNAAVRTFVHTERGRLPFQTYLVGHKGRGRVRRIEIAGAATAKPAPGVLDAIRSATAILIPPSNPLVSIGPILAVPGIRRALERRTAPAAAVSPLVGGRPIKGPLHRMLKGLGVEVSPRGIASMYRGLVDVFVLDVADARAVRAIRDLGMRVLITDTVMRTPAHARRLATAVLDALEAPR